MYFLSLLFYHITCFYFIIILSYKSIKMLYFSLLYNFIKNFTTLTVECFYYCIITIPAVYM